MDIAYLSGAVQTPPSPPAQTGGCPTAGSKLSGVPSTTPGPYFFHAINSEIRNAIVASGQTPDVNDLQQLAKAMMLLAHPVGSFYTSTDPTSPEVLFGGKWTQVKDRMIVGAGGDFGVLTTGGERSHTLTQAEMPAHTHSGSTNEQGNHTHTRGTQNIVGTFYTGRSEGVASNAFSVVEGGHYSNEHSARDGFRVDLNAANGWTGESSENGSHSHTVTINNAGGGQAFNTMSPYLAAFIWYRTA